VILKIEKMDYPSSDIQSLFEQALVYDRKGDSYSAIKLYKRIVRMAPEWPASYFQLGVIYKYRREWKQALHFNKKTVAIVPANKDAWWNLAIAATALKKWRIARNVWAKFGVGSRPLEPVSVRLTYGGQYEILGVQPLDPARGVIVNIPHPASGRRYQDVVLLDGTVSGYHVADRRKYPVFEELGLFKQSAFRTYSCRLHLENPGDLYLLEELCSDAGIGFEIWSNATRVFANTTAGKLPEYHGPESGDQPAKGEVTAAFAAHREKEVFQVLNSWQVISLGTYSDFEFHL
jgi:tetratricopeptide (TPR) repeat protein